MGEEHQDSVGPAVERVKQIVLELREPLVESSMSAPDIALRTLGRKWSRL